MPLIDKVLDLTGGPLTGEGSHTNHPADDADLPLRVFFTGLLLQAQAMRHEEDVLTLFFDLSTTAFQGFEYAADVAEAIDDLLAVAEQIAFAMTASDQVRH